MKLLIRALSLSPLNAGERMFDQPSVAMQRTRGHARVALDVRRGATRVADLHQSGSAKAMLPRTDAGVPEVVFLNTAGGLTDGDRLKFELTLGENAKATGATQTAERIYRSAGGPARAEVRLKAAKNSTLEWLPQETILFDGASLHRRTRTDLAPGAQFLCVETITLGRMAMGEALSDVDLLDRREIYRDGAPIHIESLAINRDTLSDTSTAGLAGARAICTVVLIAGNAEDRITAIRKLAAGQDVRSAASVWDGKLVVRLMASDPYPLRRVLARILTELRTRDLPRVWQL